LLSDELRVAAPDVLHDIFPVYTNHKLKEWPLVFLYIVFLAFTIRYDLMGIPHPDMPKSNRHRLTKGRIRGLWDYKRGESFIRYFETRSVIELMRASTVALTAFSDPLGQGCVDHEVSAVAPGEVWTTWTFARCGDNIFSGHASQLLSLVCVIQSYVMTQRHVGGVGSSRWAVLSAALWTATVMLSFYIVIARLHYTVDVVLAWIVVPTVWLAWGQVSGPS
jgi:hypothetical protein